MLCSSAAGAISGSLVRKIAMPGTSTGAFSLRRSIIGTNVASGTSTLRVFSNRIALPRFHVYMITVKTVVIRTGT